MIDLLTVCAVRNERFSVKEATVSFHVAQSIKPALTAILKRHILRLT